MIFEDASIEGFEPDARLTAMWLWTLAPANETALGGDDSEDNSPRDVEDPSTLCQSLRFRLEKYATAFFLV